MGGTEDFGPQPRRRALLWPDLHEPTALVRSTARIELKLIVATTSYRALMAAIRGNQRDTRTRSVYFFDTPDLALHRRGVIVRARRTRGHHDDSVIKLRHGVAIPLAGRFRRSPNLGVEVDALPETSLWSAALTRRLPRSAVAAVINRRRGLRTLLSVEQRAFFAAHAGNAAQLDTLAIHGPIAVTKMLVGANGFARKLVVENWVFPDGSQLLEVSVKCSTANSRKIATRAEQFLAEHGIDVKTRQGTKTSASLEMFSPVPGTQRHSAMDP